MERTQLYNSLLHIIFQCRFLGKAEMHYGYNYMTLFIIKVRWFSTFTVQDSLSHRSQCDTTIYLLIIYCQGISYTEHTHLPVKSIIAHSGLLPVLALIPMRWNIPTTGRKWDTYGDFDIPRIGSSHLTHAYDNNQHMDDLWYDANHKVAHYTEKRQCYKVIKVITFIH